jgi:glycosyltransferase involved in cell wall biosynthesis
MRSAALVHQGVAPIPDRPEEVLPVKRHICFVAPHIWPVLSRDAGIRMVGGAEVQQSVLIRLLRRDGYRVSVVTLDFGQPDRALVEGVTVHKTFRMQDGIPVLRFLHPRLSSTWRALKEVDADIYYYRSASMLVGVMAEFCRRYGKRSIYAAASDADFVPGHRQIRYLRDRLLFEHGLRNVDHIVVQNAAQLEACRRNFGREATLIPSSYELPAKRAFSAPECVLWVGRVMQDKRPELFIELARALPHRRFVLVGGSAGDDAYFERVRAMAAELPNLLCTGFLPLAEAETWFDRARVVVNTSAYEGMPNTFMQAWARGVPTAATVDVGAPVHRYLPEIQALKDEVERLCADPSYWDAASRACKAHFQAVHSSDAVLKRYGEVFEGLYA